MKHSSNEELDVSLKKLNTAMLMKPDTHEQLRKRVMDKCTEPIAKKSSHRKTWVSLAVALFLLIASSPIYSTTMASLAAKILPLEIPVNPSFSDSLLAEMMKIIEQTGYEVSSVGSTPNPFTIRIVLVKEEDSLSTIKQTLEPLIKQLLYDEGIDQYELDISLMEFDENDYAKFGTSHEVMHQANDIIRKAFITYDYPELAENITFGMPTKFTLEIDMPDHVKEAEAIKRIVIEEIEKEDLAITEVKLQLYNEKQRNQDNRWSSHVSTIYDALAGKSRYNVTRISYKVKKGMTYIWIKTGLSENADKQVLADIEEALHTYLSDSEVKEATQDDHYTIQLESKDKEVLLVISSDGSE